MPLMTESELVARIDEATGPDYYPNEYTCEQIGSVVLLPVIGPKYIGKTSAIEKVEAVDDEFTIATSFTTRLRRVGEDTDAYDFLPHSAPTLRRIAAGAMARDFVQCTVHPNGRIYGSSPDAYIPPYALLAPVSTEIEKLEALPFTEVIPISLVAHPDEYIQRLFQRPEQAGEPIRQSDIDEAIKSLEFSLDRGEDAFWVHNPQDRLLSTAYDIIGIARGVKEPDPKLRKMGELLLDTIRELA